MEYTGSSGVSKGLCNFSNFHEGLSRFCEGFEVWAKVSQ